MADTGWLGLALSFSCRRSLTAWPSIPYECAATGARRECIDSKLLGSYLRGFDRMASFRGIAVARDISRDVIGCLRGSSERVVYAPAGGSRSSGCECRMIKK